MKAEFYGVQSREGDLHPLNSSSDCYRAASNAQIAAIFGGKVSLSVAFSLPLSSDLLLAAGTPLETPGPPPRHWDGYTNNNCAPISVAQILRHWPKWRELARGAKKRFEGSSEEPSLMVKFGAFFESLENADRGRPPFLCPLIVNHLEMAEFEHGHQADAVEVLQRILDKVESEAEKPENQGIRELLDSLEVKTSSESRCACGCGAVHEFSVSSTVLPLVVAKASAPKRGEKRKGWQHDNAFVDCPPPAAEQQTSVQMTLTKAPSKLFIQLYRLDYVSERGVVKLDTKVVPPQVLDVGPFMAGGQGHVLYDLDGMVNHIGMENNGHYIANARVEGSTWCKFDNHKATTVRNDDAMPNGASIISYTLRG
eukprot:jgi/Undpi1/2037/HiC_scaffold_12.g05423.m1